ncbi:hypothetical protein [Solitalea lacus]|uniref:hypothetical protein n=1 Tax=Solitalea lacus TaxID=2911172 RepID=UPI001EDA3A8D|nr:hypothetical protein [Solitalea lacus]UKJ07429.1 hypothetical protein L2B55_18140 [Solitalea lacus]
MVTHATTLKSVRILLFILISTPTLLLNSCSKNDEDTVPQTGKDLLAKLNGKWSVETVEYKYYVDNVLDPDNSGTQAYDENFLVIEFTEKALIFTSQGESDDYIVSYDSSNSFRYGFGTDMSEVQVEFENGKLKWKEAVKDANIKIEVTVVLHKTP